MLFFWNRYELPALHAGLVTPQSPRMVRWETDQVDGTAAPGNPPSPIMPRLHRELPSPTARATSVNNRSSDTATTEPIPSTIDSTPPSEQQHFLRPSYSGSMRSFAAVASTSLQSLQSLASIPSSSSLIADRTTSPNLIFQGGYNFNDSGHSGDGEEDSYLARVNQ